MNIDLLVEAIGLIDDKWIEESRKMKQQRPWLKAGILAASICIVLLSYFSCKYFYSHYISDGTKIQETPHSAELCANYELELVGVGNLLYFTDSSGSMFIYDIDSGTKSLIRTSIDEKYELLCVNDEIYAFSTKSYEVYKMDGSDLVYLTSLPDMDLFSRQLVGVMDDSVYWVGYDSQSRMPTIFVSVISTHTTKKLFSPGSSIYGAYLREQKIYSLSVDGTIHCYDLNSNVLQTLSDEFANIDLYEVEPCFYFEHGILLPVRLKDTLQTETPDYNKRCYYIVDYVTGNAAYLCDTVAESTAIDYYDKKLYFPTVFIGNDGYTDVELISCEVDTGEINVIYTEDMVKFASEYVVTSSGIYYINPSYTEGGIYYFDFASGENTLIHAARVTK